LGGREYLLVVGESLELQSIARGVEEEHRPLFAGLAGETQIGLDDEVGAGCSKSVGESGEIVHIEQQAEMGNRHIVVVDRVGRGHPGAGMKMCHQLVASEIPVDPCRVAAAARTPQHLAVEMGGPIQIVHGYRQMETGPGRRDHGVTLLPATW